MPQNTNINITPYYDDFDSSKNYFQVLFKAGTPVQARELNNLQSILQDQVEKFGKHLFKEGSVVLPGSVAYDNSYTSVVVNSTFFGANVESYASGLVGKEIRGKTSGVTAIVKSVLSSTDPTSKGTTLFVKYRKSATDFTTSVFLDGETLITNEQFTENFTTFSVGSEVASCITAEATAIGSAVTVDEGVFFVRGYFVSVPSSTLVLDPYKNNTSYRVGFYVTEEIVTAIQDNTLYDNAQGFNNYTAPGADRFKLSLGLIKKDIDDYRDENFIELVTIRNGEVIKLVNKTQYSIISDELARRTYDESGNYYVNRFQINPKESLNNRYNNFGVFFPEESTIQGNTPSEDLMLAQVSPGKAYIKGYETELIGNQFVDIEKPRTTRTVKSAAIPFEVGNVFRVNNTYGAASVGIGTTLTVDLRDERIGTDQDGTPGSSIGVARVYDYKLQNAAYSDDTSVFELALFDVQTFTDLTLNQELVIDAPALIEGKNSGARGFLRSRNGVTLTLQDTAGTFLADEQIIVNGVNNGRVISSITAHSLTDAKSVRSESGITTFAADFRLETTHSFGAQAFNITVGSGSPAISTITSQNNGWQLNAKIGDIIAYTNSGISSVIYNRVTAVATNNVTVEATTSVIGVAHGGLPAATFSTSGVSVVGLKVVRPNSGYLYSQMPNEYISNVDLTNSDLFIRKEYTNETVTDNTLNLDSLTGSDFVYAPFDEERYVISYADGTVEPLTSDQMRIVGAGKSVVFDGLSKASASNVKVITTQQNSKISHKGKLLNKCSSIIVSGSRDQSSGVTTATQDGLTYNVVYGTRVQDREISLNLPDIVRVHAVFESSTTSAPTIPSITFSSFDGPNSNNTDTIVGEAFVGETSGASGIILEKDGTTTLRYVGKNQESFEVSERVKFQQSGVHAIISAINAGDQNIAGDFNLDNGQRLEFYDFGRLVRKNAAPAPSRQIRVFFDNYTVDSGDTGAFFTKNSYEQTSYSKDIPSFGGTRNTDVIDLRPRVSAYTGSNSPFEFTSRNFAGSGQSVANVVVSGENITFDYSHYLGRIDKIALNPDASISVTKGIPSLTPIAPQGSGDASFEMGTIVYKPYVFNAEDDVTITLTDFRRYTMSDIGKLDQRIENLEFYTSLNLLEINTANLLIEDPETGLNRFKSGFLVDNFGTFDVADTTIPEIKYDINGNVMTAGTDDDTVNLLVGSESIIGLNQNADSSVDADYVTDLQSENIRKNKNFVTLDYSEVTHTRQPFASKLVNVNPYDVVTWSGRMSLSPSQDNWTERVFRTIDGGWGNSETVVTSQRIERLRSQNIGITATRLKPRTNFFASFGDVDMSDTRKFTIPKLLEVTPALGTFQTGETVVGILPSTNGSQSSTRVRFRLAQADHKSGPYNAPTLTFSSNPYDDNVGLSSQYSETTTVLNIDTASFNMKADERFYGFVRKGMKLVGETSGAEATVSDVRLISDDNGALLASMHIPSSNPSFNNGTNIVKFSAEKLSYEPLPGLFVSNAEAPFQSSAQRIVTTQINRRQRPAPVDPLAQSFFVEEVNGVFYTSMDVFFGTKSTSVPVQLEIVVVENGIPSRNTVPGSVVTLEPSQVTTSTNASAATTFTFDAPVFLEPGEYAVVLKADTDAYNVWVSEVGSEDISTKNLPELEKVIINKQPSLGSLFKSQNASTWTPAQLEDLKYTAKKAKFVTNPGTLRLYNPALETFGARNTLAANAVEVLPQKVTVGLSSDLNNGSVVVGSEIRQDNATGKGIIESLQGALDLYDAGLNITNAGVGYSNGTFSNVTLSTLTGIGQDAVGIITVTSGSVDSICVTDSGSGYSVGDTLTATLGDNNLGRNLLFTVGVTTNTNAFVLTNVTGSFNETDPIQYTVAGVGSTMPGRIPNRISVNSGANDGKHFRVTHPAHGMQAANNRVKINGLVGDTIPTKLTVGYASTTLENISVASTANFNLFEGSQVNAGNPGYLLIGDEVISYTGVSGSEITGISTRGVDSTLPRSYAVGELVHKYEFAGVNLRKVNTEHSFANVSTNIENRITNDQYYVKIMGTQNFTSNKHGGGVEAKATKNVKFDAIEPVLDTTIPNATSFGGRVRTISATSVDGSEISFVDQGYQEISVDGITRFSTPRMVASKINEDARLAGMPANKSLTVELDFSTNDENVSPMLDLSSASLLTFSNKVNNPVSNYVTDSRTNTLSEDPHEYVYMTKVVSLENPASALKVLLSADRPASADIRVLYRLFRTDNPEIERVFELFPGYDNLDASGQVIDATQNSGRSDRQVVASQDGQFIDYVFTANNLPQFTGYQIKVVSSTTNQALSPRIKDFRSIALA
jgi:hypothetical protein